MSLQYAALSSFDHAWGYLTIAEVWGYQLEGDAPPARGLAGVYMYHRFSSRRGLFRGLGQKKKKEKRKKITIVLAFAINAYIRF